MRAGEREEERTSNNSLMKQSNFTPSVDYILHDWWHSYSLGSLLRFVKYLDIEKYICLIAFKGATDIVQHSACCGSFCARSTCSLWKFRRQRQYVC